MHLRQLGGGHQDVRLATVPTQIGQAVAALAVATGGVCAVACRLLSGAVAVAMPVTVAVAMAVAVAMPCATSPFVMFIST